MKRVLIVGATGNLERFLCAAYQRRGWYVIALVAPTPLAKPITADLLVEAQISDPVSIEGVMTGVDLVVSCLGIKLQADKPDDQNVDYQTSLNLLHEAERAGVEQFLHIHALGALDPAELPRVLNLDTYGVGYDPTNAKDRAEDRLAETPSASIHHLSIDRKTL